MGEEGPAANRSEDDGQNTRMMQASLLISTLAGLVAIIGGVAAVLNYLL